MAWRSFWLSPASSLLAAGWAGEILISKVRVVAAAAAFGLASVGFLRFPQAPEAVVYLGTTLLAVPVAVGLHFYVRRADYRWSIGFATSLLDVLIVGGCLLAMLFVGRVELALENPVAYPMLFIALSATSMRLDHRACAVSGVFAMFLYVSMVALALLGLGGREGLEAAFTVGDQVARTLLLGAMGFIGTVVNLRMQKPHILSANDGLTGIMNRRAFEERWDGEVARARRYGRPISIAAIDIDYFKQFNDTYGHAAGDLALRSVARVVRSRIRAGDFVARLGGEEFVIALPETTSANAVALAESVRRAVAENPITIPGSRTPVGVTISLGVASWPEHGEEVSRLLERADDRLYEAKLAGRDQVKGPTTLRDVPRPAPY
jgi:two-component system, cell cycle response regulator